MREGCTCWYVDQMKRNRARKKKEKRIDRVLDTVCLSAIVVSYIVTISHIIASFV